MTRISPLNYDPDGFAQVELTREQAELIGEALYVLWAQAPARRTEVEDLTSNTGLLMVTDSDAGDAS